MPSNPHLDPVVVFTVHIMAPNHLQTSLRAALVLSLVSLLKISLSSHCNKALHSFSSAMQAQALLQPPISLARGLIKDAGCMLSIFYVFYTKLINHHSDIGRTLTGSSFSNSTMTNELCVNFCNDNGYIYAGTEYALQCFCGATVAAAATQVNGSTDCVMPCAGNSSEICGGSSRLSLFWSGVSPPSTNPGPGPWSFVGCYS